MQCKVTKTLPQDFNIMHHNSIHLWRLWGQTWVTAYCCLLQKHWFWTLARSVCMCVCVCTLSDLIRLYLWWCLTPLRAWQLLPFSFSVCLYFSLLVLPVSSLSSACLCCLSLLFLSLRLLLLSLWHCLFFSLALPLYCSLSWWSWGNVTLVSWLICK